MEALLVEEEVLSRLTEITAEKSHNFQVQIVATTKKSESVLQPKHSSVFSPYLEF
jgi:hypothetical protein